MAGKRMTKLQASLTGPHTPTALLQHIDRRTWPSFFMCFGHFIKEFNVTSFVHGDIR